MVLKNIFANKTLSISDFHIAYLEDNLGSIWELS